MGTTAARASLFLFLLLSACVSYDELRNMNEAELVVDTPNAIANRLKIVIQPDDLLDIKVFSSVEEALQPFIPAGGGQRTGNMNQGIDRGSVRPLFGYRVDALGNISFPLLGPVPVAGRTLNEARDLLIERLREYLTDVVVDLQFINFRVSIIGEVNNPGTFNMPTDRSTILDLIAQAGDLTSYAKRENVLIIREIEGERTYGRVNLQSESLFDSPYFYLSQNDIVYVEPLRVRTATVADPFARWISYTSGVLSLITLIIAFTR